ncbi:hypothetical protein [Cellulomonas citrea]|uniref:hypothetical protein n=1 Tax=Cellulomonas citrea TaxID=1909423 RepID=UPI001357F247|nr:hypothetical protein [Cellulomonas citrea]
MTVTAETRADRARAALALAEERTGARRVALAAAEPVEQSGVRAVSLLTQERPPMAVPPGLAPLLPEGLRRGAVTAVLGSSALLLAMVAHACADGAWAVAVGHPGLGVLAAARSGVPLDRFALVPRPGAQAATVLAALVDGFGLVVVGPEVALPAADVRRLVARVRERGAAVLTTSVWSGGQAVLEVTGARWVGLQEGSGLQAGAGRLRSARLHVVRRDRVRAPALDLRLPVPPPTSGPAPLVPTPGLRLVG